MKAKLPVLYVNMFGEIRFRLDGRAILPVKGHATKTMKLLLILLHSGPAGISRSQLTENLYGREEMADVTNNLRVACHRLKKLLMDAGLPEYEYISVKEGVYSWQSPMEVQVDARLFEELTERASQAPDEAGQIECLKKACALYTGEFLQSLSDEEWVLMESLHYQNLYTNALQRVCAYLQEQGDYKEALRIVSPACTLYPFEEWQSVKIDCYIALNRYQDALAEYEETTRLFFHELGIEPSEKMLRQMEEISSHINGVPRPLSEIRAILREPGTDDGGAYFCNFPSFRDTYRLLCRVMERYGQSIYLMLCSLSQNQNHPPGTKRSGFSRTNWSPPSGTACAAVIPLPNTATHSF